MKTSNGKVQNNASILPHRLHRLIAAAFIVLVLLLGLPTSVYVAQRQADQLIQDRGQHLYTLATATAAAVATNLRERMREVELLAQSSLYTHGALDSRDLGESLKRIRKSYPHYSWMGVAALDGTVLHATENMLLGQSVAARPWFQQARSGAYVGDLHEAALLGKLLRDQLHEWPIRFLDFAAPVFDAQGQLRAVVGSHVHWRWAQEVIAKLKPLDVDSHGIEIFIVNQANAVIYPDRVESVQSLPSVPRISQEKTFGFYAWGGDKSYLTAAAAVAEPLAQSPSPLGWQVVVRQPRSAVLSEVLALQTVVVVVMGVAVLLFIVFAWRLGHWFSRPITQLSEGAWRIAEGDETVTLAVSSRSSEIQQLSASMGRMAASLLQRKNALESINRNLESMVAERTAALEAANQELALLARKDVLTGLPNRLAANERLRLEFQQMKRNTAPYALMVMDIDFFKKVNDTYGHAAGDDVLRHVAQLLKTALRETDFVGRVGGEEFLVILPRTELEAAVLVAEKIRATVEGHPIEPVGRVSLSIGLVMASLEQTSEEVAVNQADALLYKAKEGGRNRVVSASSNVAR